MKRLGVQLDPVDRLNPAHDTSLALMRAADARGWRAYVFQPKDLSYRDGAVTARACAVKWSSALDGRPGLGEADTIALADLDVVLIRQDPPYDARYHTNTFLMETAARETVVVNDPRAIRNTQEKLSALHFADLMPATYVGCDTDAIDDFARDQGEVVFKPVDMFGGAGVTRSRWGDNGYAAARDAALGAADAPILVQRFLPNVATTDKRVMLIEGEVVGALNRRPPEGGFVANIHAGGRAMATELTADELRVAETVGRAVKEWGVFFAGIDLIDARLSEINVTSPTLVMELKDVGGPDIAEIFWDRLEARLKR